MPMMTVKEVSEKAGVSVRTLHYYDQIGLLRPDGVTEAGYRLYSHESLLRLQSILLLRELEFPLKAIMRILDASQVDKAAAMEQQIRLLTMKRNRLSGLISLAERIRKGENIVDLKAFDKSSIDKYAKEAKERWGNTPEYRESEKRMEQQGAAGWKNAAQAIMDCFVGLGGLKDMEPAAEQVQLQVKELQDTITATFFSCTKETLAQLGKMYVGDERFRSNIDQAGGEGTAEFAARAIEEYCKQR